MVLKLANRKSREFFAEEAKVTLEHLPSNLWNRTVEGLNIICKNEGASLGTSKPGASRSGARDRYLESFDTTSDGILDQHLRLQGDLENSMYEEADENLSFERSKL